MAQRQVIVIGGGLSGMSAAHSALEAGARVLVLDKMAFCGGNSTKATSGMNGAGTRAQVGTALHADAYPAVMRGGAQRALGIPDTPEIFEADTLKSAAGGARPEVVRVLTHQASA